jgi:hypothetical protein
MLRSLALAGARAAYRSDIMTRTLRWPYAITAALGITLSACASQPERHAGLASLPGTEGCFWTRTVYDWVALDSATLIVSASDQSPYLVKLLGPIPGLGARENLRFHTGRGGGELFCSANHSFVSTPGRAGWWSTALAVRRLTPAQARQLSEQVDWPLVHHAPAIYPAQSDPPTAAPATPTG